MPLVTSGVEHGNLRELALARMKELGTSCRDVRFTDSYCFKLDKFQNARNRNPGSAQQIHQTK